jgi:hypothetical protein
MGEVQRHWFARNCGGRKGMVWSFKLIFLRKINLCLICYLVEYFSFEKQWLVTARAKEQWTKYKTMLANANAKIYSDDRLCCSAQETSKISGIALVFDTKHINYFLLTSIKSASVNSLFMSYLDCETDFSPAIFQFCMLCRVSYCCFWQSF